MRPQLLALTLLTTPLATHAQWTLQDAHTTADLRGIDNLGNGVAWASGTNGTVLRTEDAGFVWQLCAMPPNAEQLDFRAIQAFDNSTAIIMSSGKGDLSRLYKTTDGCQTWTLLFTNPDQDGFWDALRFDEKKYGILLGDPVANSFVVFTTKNQGTSWARRRWTGLEVDPAKDEVFAASNSSMQMWTFLTHTFFVTGGPGGAHLLQCSGELKDKGDVPKTECGGASDAIPVGNRSPSSGAFSLGVTEKTFIAVGGDYLKPNQGTNTAAYSTDAGGIWHAAQTPPHGYRSAVAYDKPHNTWITVGPNGTDISTDDGRNWRPLQPNPAAGDPPDADQHFNALSLPYAVGPHGRIATLRPNALSTPPSKAR